LHVGTFTPGGTFDSAIEKLGLLGRFGRRLRRADAGQRVRRHSWLGVYDGVLWYAVHEPYGGPDGLVRLINACHRRGLGVLIDACSITLARRATTCRGSGRICPSGSNPWGESINISDTDADEGAALHSRLRLALDA
jgi:maltooligosyltrehalose trehalohydrolase